MLPDRGLRDTIVSPSRELPETPFCFASFSRLMRELLLTRGNSAQQRLRFRPIESV
jgi:hypothetical protein